MATTEIIVEGYSPRFAAALRKLLKVEGGYVNDPKDRGGATKYGISLRYLVAAGEFDDDGDGKADFDLDMDGDIDSADIRKLSLGDAAYLYHRDFWLKCDCDAFARPLGEAIFDQAVNGGRAAAKRLVQQAINRCLTPMNMASRAPFLKEDGQIGAATLAAYTAVLAYPACGMTGLISAYRLAAADRYRAIVARTPSQARFIRGWLARANDLGRD